MTWRGRARGAPSAARARAVPAAGLLVVMLLAPVSTPAAWVAGCQVVADLARTAVGQFPADWKPRDARAREVYRVVEDGGGRFIRATAEGAGSQMGREFPWDLGTHPVLAWRWRPRVFPAGGDEREGGRNDSALGVYAVFPHLPMTVRTVKYVWSLAAPAGTTASASNGLTRMVVLRSGPPGDPGVGRRDGRRQPRLPAPVRRGASSPPGHRPPDRRRSDAEPGGGRLRRLPRLPRGHAALSDDSMRDEGDSRLPPGG